MAGDTPAILGGDPIFPNGPPPWPLPDDDVAAVLQATIADGTWGRYHGPHTDALTGELKSWSGCEHIELCSSGTAASELALRAFKVSPGDEVIIGAYDYAASFKNVLMLGARPVLIDVEPATFAVTPERIEAAITERTEAVVVSHLHGGLADMPAIMDLARQRGLLVLEDACQATGATINDRVVGSFGTLGIISFGGSKLITAGRGGAIIGHDQQLFQRMHVYGFRGNTAYPLSAIQAAIVLPQLKSLAARNTHRSERVAEFRALLEPCCGLTVVAEPTSSCSAAFYKLGLMIDEAEAGLTRDQFSAAARAEGIACDRTLHGLHTVHSKRRFRAPGELLGATRINDYGLQLHHPILLGTQTDISLVAQAFVRLVENAAAIAEHAPASC